MTTRKLDPLQYLGELFIDAIVIECVVKLHALRIAISKSSHLVELRMLFQHSFFELSELGLRLAIQDSASGVNDCFVVRLLYFVFA